MAQNIRKTSLLGVLFAALLLSLLLDLGAFASPDDGEKDWWTGTAIWKAWRTVNLLNRTGLTNYTRPLNQSSSYDWLRNIWVGIAAASRLTSPTPPLSPVWPIPIPTFPKLDLGSLFKMPSTLSPDLGIFRKIWDEILGKPVEPYDDRPSSPQEGLEESKERLPIAPESPEHKAAKEFAKNELIKLGEGQIIEERYVEFTDEQGYCSFRPDLRTKNRLVECKTGNEHWLDERELNQLSNYIRYMKYYAKKTGKMLELVYCLNREPNSLDDTPHSYGQWLEFKSLLNGIAEIWIVAGGQG